MKQNRFLGIDLGTSSVKLLLTDSFGTPLAEATAEYPMYGQERGWFEQKTGDWIAAICLAMEQLDRICGELNWKSHVKAIGISAQMPTMVLMDEAGQVLRNAIVWCDNRAAKEGEALLQAWGAERHYRISGVLLDGRYLVPMYLWVKENEPQLLKCKHYLLSAGDYIYYWLCGEIATTPSTASGYGVYDIEKKDWNRQLIKQAGISLGIFPEVRDSFDGSGQLCKEAAERLELPEEVTVVCGGADSVCGILGMGGERSGTVCLICGSSTAILGVTNDLHLEDKHPFFITPTLETEVSAMEADLLATGNTQKWLRNRMSDLRGTDASIVTYDEMARMACSSPAGAEKLLFFPYLSGGEQGVLWDDTLQGGWIGLTLNHGWNHMIRAVYEGICFEIRRCLEAFREGGLRVQKILVTGPVSLDDVFMQILSDVTGYRCTVSKVTNASARGAALAAICAVNGKKRVKGQEDEQVFFPEETQHKAYQEFYQSYLAVSSRLKIKG